MKSRQPQPPVSPTRELFDKLVELREGLQETSRRASDEAQRAALDKLRQLCLDALALISPAAKDAAPPDQVLALGEWLQRRGAALGPDELEVVLALSDGLPALSLDEDGLARALSELMTNAASCGARKVRLSARTTRLSLSELPPDISPGDYLCIEVTDDGAAPKPPRGRGTVRNEGVSRLAQQDDSSRAYAFVRAHGGALRQESRRGSGTTATLYLPLSRVWDASTAAGDRSDQDERASTILLVDDEPFARSAARRVLRSLGHQVLEASRGSEARALLAQGGHVDLLLTDVNMPEMDGFELARALRELQPDLCTLYMCGYPAETIADAPAGAQFIEKPFTYEDLASKVGQLLERR